jgi:hypothetical protein
MRVSGTVWWFLEPFVPDDDLLSPQNHEVLYPQTKHRLSPQPNGADLLGRCFMEPKSGVCCITKLGHLSGGQDDTLEPTLHYRCLAT